MKLEIKLKDPKYCNGCPCVEMLIGGVMADVDEYYCNVYDKKLKETKDRKKLIRPKICIKQNGK